MNFTPAYYKLYLNPLSRWPRAFSNRTENFAWQYLPDPYLALCEIAYIHEGSLVEQLPEGKKIYPQGTVHTILHNRDFQEFCPDPIYHEYVIRFSVYTPYEPISVEEVANWIPESYYAIIPEYIDDPAACDKIGSLLKHAVRVFKKEDPFCILQMQGTLCECLGILTKQAVLQAQRYLEAPGKQKSPVTERACRYIKKHLAQKCSMEELTRNIGVSYHYLSQVFRRDMSMSVVEYWNRSRVRKVEHLITVEGMTLAQAGEAVGISDVKYLSRLFRRYTGTTPQDFRHVYHIRSSSTMKFEE